MLTGGISPLGQGPRVFPGWAAKWAQAAKVKLTYALGLGARGTKVVVFGERRLRKQGLPNGVKSKGLNVCVKK